jgi:hypothetical protein
MSIHSTQGVMTIVTDFQSISPLIMDFNYLQMLTTHINQSMNPDKCWLLGRVALEWVPDLAIHPPHPATVGSQTDPVVGPCEPPRAANLLQMGHYQPLPSIITDNVQIP